MDLKLLQIKEASGLAIHCSKDVYDMMYHEAQADRETFWVLHLNIKLAVIEKELVFMGTLDGCTVHAREIFKKAIVNSTCSIICVHNHPSGDPEPSEADLETSKMLVKAGALLGIPVTDFIIVGTKGYYSFGDKDLIDKPLFK
jgi:DNA repair protein RadC